MAEVSSEKLNKSDHIRLYISKHRKAGPKAIVEALHAQGVKVSLALAAAVKYTKKGKRKGTRTQVSAAKVIRPGRGVRSLSANDLIEAKRFVTNFGGIARLKQALATIEELQ